MGEKIMQYYDSKQNMNWNDEQFLQAYELLKYIESYITVTDVNIIKNLINSGYTVESFLQPEYKNLPVEWVIKLFS
jgi:hypothetical protein